MVGFSKCLVLHLKRKINSEVFLLLSTPNYSLMKSYLIIMLLEFLKFKGQLKNEFSRKY